ncbi:hypothetical protein [Dyadobacter pollutisoli]|uniref:Uncharacterized protein n=1 Tax=Dyadobacter pollutisoli TaxID=2910158 RepID=A0A9E8SS54_9BACT|nr:hypothetical protein [Dyadobacter pollutisoli]WAC14957.1 hypothetical protein ON006_13525 [Dyadobacter pollutisoli]
MKFRDVNREYISGLLFTLAVVLTLSTSSCSRKLVFKESAIVPAAQGNVKVKKDKNENYAIDLSVRHLSPPERLIQSRDTYVLWADTERNGIKNLGQIKSRHGIFSKGLKSDLKTVSTFEPRNFFITAERAADIPFPEGQVVLTTD